MFRKLLPLILLFQFTLEATDFKPWFGNQYEVEIRASCLYQNYKQHNDAFFTLSAAYPLWRYCGEFEATAAATRTQNGRWDNFRVTGRYQWMSELDGSAFSLVTGITLDEPFSRALHDISSFHHGHLEGEFFLSFGQQYRWWGVIGFGSAEIGSPWVRGEAAFECYRWRLFVNSLFGMGDRDLDHHHFKGYGNVKHKSVDVGLRYTYEIECSGSLILQYARRVYASNFPEDANLVLLEYYYPFGIQPSSRY